MSVLVGYDGSPASDAALIEAALTAVRREVPLHLVRYLPHELGESMTQVRREVEESSDEQDALETFAAGWRERGIDVHLHIEHGPSGGAADAILRLADEVDAELIVLGWTARSKIEEVVLGSVARQVRRRAGRPIMTVPAASD
ncbi:MAG: universal stress protein [Nitriliruptoraceae bacterium]|nr:universal stress protein [Nitriliruptoraceae bacterium]